MTERKNIFRIGRRGHWGDENQLTEMLAFLFQEEPAIVSAWLAEMGFPSTVDSEWLVETQRAVPSGFLDLVLFVPGQALVVVESKLGSTTDFEQISKYLRYAHGIEADTMKALVLLTQNHEPWPEGVEAEAGDAVVLVDRRWQTLAQLLRDRLERLAQDFVEMLEEEGLVTPRPFSQDDWQTWNRGNRISDALRTLLNEASGDLEQLEPGFRKSGSVISANNGLIYRLSHFEGVSLGAGFWPTRRPADPTHYAMVVAFALNTTLPEAQRKAAGQIAVERARDASVALTDWTEGYVQRSQPAHAVLLGDTFAAQLEDVVRHVHEFLSLLHQIEYLDPGAVSHASE